MDQLTAAKLTCAQTQEMLRGGVTGVELILGDAISDAQSLEACMFAALDRFRIAHAEMPVLAAGVTCELLSLEGTLTIVQPVLAGCAARNVQCLNLAISPPAAADAGASSVGYAETAHIVYTALRDLRHCIEASGVVVNLEAGRHGLFLSPLEMRQMIDAINSWAMGACVDVPHVSSFSRAADWISTLGRRLRVTRTTLSGSERISFDGLVVLRT